jgi:formylmethanofuran dehydrogenase subunit E
MPNPSKTLRGEWLPGTIRCDKCGIPIPEPPEDAAYTELLCDRCAEMFEEWSALQ